MTTVSPQIVRVSSGSYEIGYWEAPSFSDDYFPGPDPVEIGWVQVQSTSLEIICTPQPASQPLSMQERRVVHQSPVLVAERIHAYYPDDLEYAIEVQGDVSPPKCDPSVCSMQGCPSSEDPTD